MSAKKDESALKKVEKAERAQYDIKQEMTGIQKSHDPILSDFRRPTGST